MFQFRVKIPLLEVIGTELGSSYDVGRSCLFSRESETMSTGYGYSVTCFFFYQIPEKTFLSLQLQFMPFYAD